MMQKQPGSAKHQSGAVLAVVLILLVVMTLLAVASLRGTLMEERMSANMHDRSIAFQAAEAALREAEEEAGANKPTPSAGCANGLCGIPDADDPDDQQRWLGGDEFWETGATRLVDIDLGEREASARYIIELISTGLPADDCTTSGDVSPDAFCEGLENRYRITARSSDDSGSEVILQSIFAVP